MLKISLLCSDTNHPIYPKINNWVNENDSIYEIEVVASMNELRDKGDFLFLLSCNELISNSIAARFLHTLVLHASDLPIGKGWSPHIWQIIEGARSIVLTLLEADEKVDSGKIWLQRRIKIRATDLFDDINNKIFTAEFELIEEAIKQSRAIEALPQNSDVKSTYYQKRTPDNSKLDITKSLEDQFNLLRVCDPNRYPAFFDYHGQRYILEIKKVDLTDDEK